MTIFPQWAQSKKVLVQIAGMVSILILAAIGAPEWAYVAIGVPMGTHSYAQGRVDEIK